MTPYLTIRKQSIYCPCQPSGNSIFEKYSPGPTMVFRVVYTGYERLSNALKVFGDHPSMKCSNSLIVSSPVPSHLQTAGEYCLESWKEFGVNRAETAHLPATMVLYEESFFKVPFLGACPRRSELLPSILVIR